MVREIKQNRAAWQWSAQQRKTEHHGHCSAIAALSIMAMVCKTQNIASWQCSATHTNISSWQWSAKPKTEHHCKCLQQSNTEQHGRGLRTQTDPHGNGLNQILQSIMSMVCKRKVEHYSRRSAQAKHSIMAMVCQIQSRTARQWYAKHKSEQRGNGLQTKSKWAPWPIICKTNLSSMAMVCNKQTTEHRG